MKITYSIDINAPRSVVWDYLEDPEKLKLWMKGVERIEDVERTPEGVGSRSKMWIREGRKVSEYDIETTVYDKEAQLEVKMKGGCFRTDMAMFANYRLSDVDGPATRVDYVCTAEGVSGMFKLMGPLFAIFGKVQLKSFMKRMKTLAESEARGVMA